jgi:hypothetical protein
MPLPAPVIRIERLFMSESSVRVAATLASRRRARRRTKVQFPALA